MEMDDTSATFKTQWLNETLKFLKNDQELIYKYPEWPISRVKFYHALVAQRQLSAGLGFKTLYAPLWEAMQVFGLKYTFKVSILSSKDGERGRLILEKIPIETQEDNDIDSEEESTCKHTLTKKTKQEYLLNKAIVERNSPTFIKNTLQSLLGFINDEASASIVFKGLAPIEAKFIQNIQAIHDQKFLFYKIFSPSTIETLKKITASLSSFKNTYDIKVGNVTTHPMSAKREITLVKEPNFGKPSSSPSTTSSRSQTKKMSKLKQKSSHIMLKAPLSVKQKPLTVENKLNPNSSESALRSPISVQTKSTPVECIANSLNHDVSKTKPKEIDKETTTEIVIESQPANVAKINENNMKRPVKPQLLNVEDICKSDTGKENSPTNANKTENKVKSKLRDESKEEYNLKLTENESISTTVIDKVNSKANESPGDTNIKPSLSRSGQKKAIMEAMSKPLESDKGIRIMKRMGWEGGALGLRGDGIMEPIIPSLLLKPKAGLGAPRINIEEIKTKTKRGAKQTRSSVTRNLFLEGVIEALVNGNSTICFKSSLNSKEVKFYINNIVELNRRARVSHNCNSEKIMVDTILDKLAKVPEKIIDYSFMHNASELCLRVINRTDGVIALPPTPKPAADTGLPEKLLDIDYYIQSKTGKPKRREFTINRLAVKLYTLLMVADFVDSDDLDMNMDFSFGYCKKVYKYMQRICTVLNEGKPSNKIKSAEEVEMLQEISAGLKSSFLSVHLCSPLVTVRKLKLSSKQRPIIDYKQLFDVPQSNKTNNDNGASDSESGNEHLIKEPSKVEFYDNYDKIIVKSKKISEQESTDNKNTTDTHIDLMKVNLNYIDFNDNILNSDITSEINLTKKSCDTNSHKDNIDMNREVQKDSIDVLEYKEYNIVKIVLEDWKDLDTLSRKIQENIVNCDYFYQDNYLKCHGIQNGGLLYYCSNVDWFNDILSKQFNVNYISGKMEKFQMKVHINSFIRVEDILKSLEVHNRGLCTADWTVLEDGNCYFVVNVDCDSFRLVCDKRFSLFAGVDAALFTIVL